MDDGWCRRWSVLAFILLLTSACGRINFDERVLDGSSPRTDAAGNDGGQSRDTGVDDSDADGGMGDAGSVPIGVDAFTTTSRLTTINSPGIDTSPTLTEDRRLILFASNRGDGLYRLYQATRATVDDVFASPVVVAELDAGEPVFSPSLSRDGLELYFAQQTAAGGESSRQIYRSTRSVRTDPWGAPILETNLSSDDMDTGVSVDPGGQWLLLATATPGAGDARSRLDIYLSSRAPGDSSWNPPALLPLSDPTIRDSEPAIVSGGLVAVFDSSRLGSLDLFYATRASVTEQFGPVQPITTVNTDTDREKSPWLSADLTVMYFTATSGGDADQDIWVARR